MRRDARHLVEQMFGVVEQDQDLERCDRARQRFGRVADGGRHAEGRRDGVRDLSRIGHRRQVDEADAVHKGSRARLQQRLRQPRLADATGAGDRDQPVRAPMAVDQRAKCEQVVVASEQGREHRRQVGTQHSRRGRP